MSDISILDDAARRFLASARTATLATIGPSGRPRLVPICFVLRVDDPGAEVRLFSPLDDKPKAGDDPHDLARVRDLLARPEATLLVDRWSEDWTELAWLRLDARAELLEAEAAEPRDRAERVLVIDALRAKYPQYATHRLEERPILRFTIGRVRSWGPLGSSLEMLSVGPLIFESTGGPPRVGSNVADGDIELPIAGHIVSSVAMSQFSPHLTLRLLRTGTADTTTGADYTLQIDGRLRLVVANGESTIEPESGPDPATLGLLEKTVSRAIASGDGSLQVDFADGQRLLVAPDVYEPWQLNGSDGSLVASGAGGGLAVWGALDPG